MSEFVMVKRELLDKWISDLEGATAFVVPDQIRAVLAQEAGYVEAASVGVEGMPQYLIMFDDAERPVETMFGEEIARKRYADISMSWNAHLFVKIDSNSRDAMFAKNNATVYASPPAPVSVVLPERMKVSNLASPEARAHAYGHNEAIDKVKELNQPTAIRCCQCGACSGGCVAESKP